MQKYNKGRKVEGHWILGMIDVETKELRIAVCRNNCRSAETMLPWIEDWVEKGSIIRTDCWAAYNKLKEKGYIHETVNHSKEFVTAGGVHTNLIESSWRPLKTHFRDIKIPSVCSDCKQKFSAAKEETKEMEGDSEKQRDEKMRTRTKLYADIRREKKDCKHCEELEVAFGFKIIEYLWRRETKKHGIDPFERILSAIRHVEERHRETPIIYQQEDRHGDDGTGEGSTRGS